MSACRCRAFSETGVPLAPLQAETATTSTPSAHPINSFRILVILLPFVLPGQRARDDLHIWPESRLGPPGTMNCGRARANRAYWRFEGGAGTPVGGRRAPTRS